MKSVAIIAMICAGVTVGLIVASRHFRNERRALREAIVPEISTPSQATKHLTSRELQSMTSSEGGESHSMAVDDLVNLAKRRQTFAPDEMQALLSFISAPKPEALTDGEWEERVNVVLNALRVQGKEVPGLTEFLLTTAEQYPSRILRLYAMQHLALWHHRERSVEKRRENQEWGSGHIELSPCAAYPSLIAYPSSESP
jgi:hypothetical protein